MGFQDDFDLTIGRLDRALSKLVGWGRLARERLWQRTLESLDMDGPNRQTLKHHAEDMIAAGQKILRDLTPTSPVPSCPDLASPPLTPEEREEIDSVE